MKKLVAIAIVFLFIVSVVPVFAQVSTRKGPNPSQKAYEHASEKSAFNRVGDWFATAGKSPEEKEKIIAERDAQRAAKQVEKEAKRLRKQAEKETEGLTQKKQQRTEQKTQKQTMKSQKARGKGMQK